MRRYWESDFSRKRREKSKGGGPSKGWDKQGGTEVYQIDGDGKKYLLG